MLIKMVWELLKVLKKQSSITRGASLGSMECAKSLAILFNKLSDHIEANAGSPYILRKQLKIKQMLN